jgi:hypothetical protein
MTPWLLAPIESGPLPHKKESGYSSPPRAHVPGRVDTMGLRLVASQFALSGTEHREEMTALYRLAQRVGLTRS